MRLDALAKDTGIARQNDSMVEKRVRSQWLVVSWVSWLPEVGRAILLGRGAVPTTCNITAKLIMAVLVEADFFALDRQYICVR